MKSRLLVWMVVVGDAMATGYPNSQKDSWINLIFEGNVFVINNSKVGHYSGSILSELEYDIESYNPEYVLVHCGTEDAIRGMPVEEFSYNIKQMVDLANNKRIKIIFCIPPISYRDNVEKLLEKYRACIHKVAQDCEIIDIYEWMQETSEDDFNNNECYKDFYIDEFYLNQKAHIEIKNCFEETFYYLQEDFFEKHFGR